MTISCAFICALTRDPEFKLGKTGKPYANFTCVAGDQRVNVICFGDLAGEYREGRQKGDKVFIEGAIRLASWTDGEGQPKYGLAVSATRAEKLFAAQPSLPIALPARKKKRPTFGLFRKKKKALAQDSADKCAIFF